MIKRLLIMMLTGICFLVTCPDLYSASIDAYWSTWRGPADGTVCLKESPGASLGLLWTLNLLDPDNNGSFDDAMGHPVDDVYRSGTHIRTDESRIYMKVTRDYAPVANPTVYIINPDTGVVEWAPDQANGQDTSTPRALQLYQSPQGFIALNVAAFYASYWDTLNLEDFSSQKQFYHSHSNIGSRIIMGEWAWQNSTMIPDYDITYHHGGRLYFWNENQYEQYSQEDLCLLDHVWDNEKAVIFVLSGFTNDAAVPFEKARYMVLDRDGHVTKDSEISDIYRPNCPRNWRTDNTDVVMRLAMKGDDIYAIERTTSTETNLVGRKISQDFALSSSLFLGTASNIRATSLCLDDHVIYLHTDTTISAYTLDLGTLIWEQTVPFRTLHHSSIQTFDYARFPGNRNYAQQTIACDGTYLYHTADDRLQVRIAANGLLVYEYIFTDLPNSRQTPSGYTVAGKAGDVIIMPEYVLVVSALDTSKVWAFEKQPVSMDINSDGKVTSQDAFNAVDIILLREAGIADINGDGHSDIKDVVTILNNLDE